MIFSSYLVASDAQAYFDTRLNSDSWNNASDSDKTKALITATRLIDRLNFSGYKSDPAQFLQFPRGNYIDDPTIVQSDVLLPLDLVLSSPPQKFVFDTIIPQSILIATCEIAFELLDGKDINLEIENLGVVNRSILTTKTTYDRSFVPDYIRAGIPSAIAWEYLRPYLRDPYSVETVRAS